MYFCIHIIAAAAAVILLFIVKYSWGTHKCNIIRLFLLLLLLSSFFAISCSISIFFPFASSHFNLQLTLLLFSAIPFMLTFNEFIFYQKYIIFYANLHSLCYMKALLHLMVMMKILKCYVKYRQSTVFSSSIKKIWVANGKSSKVWWKPFFLDNHFYW